MTYSKYDLVWEKIFEDWRIIDRIGSSKAGYIELTPDQIKKSAYGNEIRLLNNRLKDLNTVPPIFVKNNLSAISLTRNHYAIGHFRTHQEVNYDDIPVKDPLNIKWLKDADTMYLSNITQEKQMSSYVQNSGILDDIFGEPMLSTLSGGGSMGSGTFNFRIHDILNEDKFYNMYTDNALIEIDNCSEGKNTVVIQEYKPKAINNFIIRQLYYPYRSLKDFTNKVIYVMFVTLSKDKDVLHCFIYEFTDMHDYNSLVLIQKYNYKVYRKNSNKILQRGLR